MNRQDYYQHITPKPTKDELHYRWSLTSGTETGPDSYPRAHPIYYVEFGASMIGRYIRGDKNA